MVPRRAFLADLGRGAFAIAVIGVAGCAPVGGPAAGSRSAAASSWPAGSGADPTPGPPGSGSGSGEGVAWTRVNLGFVSAYVLVRGGEAAVVDTGTNGSAPAIEEALAGIGLGWDAVGHVIATHHHGDHVGSLAAVLEAAPAATAYAGAADIPAISASRTLTAVGDGDRVFDLDVVATPGHTAGHIAVLDPAAGVLVAGDALTNQDGVLAGPSAEFTDDMAEAEASIARLAELEFETLLVGHGEPIESGASEAVAALAAG
jgi:glyoxylase-like metal-dependent hydrolase (beta-lactamase superfamily II)